MDIPRLMDDDHGEITVLMRGVVLRQWSYADDRRAKMLRASGDKP